MLALISFSVTRSSEIIGIESGIRVQEQPLHWNIGLFERSRNDLELHLYIEKVVVVARYGFGHGQRQSLPIGQVEGVGRLALLPSLIFYRFTVPDGRGMAAVKFHTRKVQSGPVLF
jgi:hypothetical protein